MKNITNLDIKGFNLKNDCNENVIIFDFDYLKCDEKIPYKITMRSYDHLKYSIFHETIKKYIEINIDKKNDLEEEFKKFYVFLTKNKSLFSSIIENEIEEIKKTSFLEKLQDYRIIFSEINNDFVKFSLAYNLDKKFLILYLKFYYKGKEIKLKLRGSDLENYLEKNIIKEMKESKKVRMKLLLDKS